MMLPLGLIIFPYLNIQLNKIKKNKDKKIFFLYGFLFGLGFFNFLFIWLINPFLVYEETKPYFLFSFLFPLFLSVILGFYFIFFKYIKDYLSSIIFIPIIFVFFEILVSNLFYSFPWTIFSLIVSNNFLGLLLIKYFGTHFTSFIVISFFMLPSLFIYRKKIKLYSKIIIFIFICSISLFVLLINYFSYNNKNYEKNLSFELFQMNNDIKKLNSNDSEKIYKSIIKNIRQSNAEVLIFSENNYPYLVKNLNDLGLNSFLKHNQKLVIGATRHEEGEYFNSLLVLDKNKTNFFDKKILVPFGEFLPLRKHLSFMEAISGSQDFSSGSQNRILDLNDKISFIPIICYEIIFFWKLIDTTNYNADILINITNDSWFGQKIGPYQHFYLSKIKAAEFNKMLIRVSNNGITAIIDNKGNLLQSTNLNQMQKIKGNLSIKNNTNYVKFHKYFNLILLIFFFLQIFLIFNKKNAK